MTKKVAQDIIIGKICFSLGRTYEQGERSGKQNSHRGYSTIIHFYNHEVQNEAGDVHGMDSCP
jgi:hypothetical protein